MILRISLDEVDNREQLGMDLRPNGFTETCDITDFPAPETKRLSCVSEGAGG